MKTAGVAELKAKLSAHLALVKRGEEILVTERGRPIARIVPVEPAETDEEARVQRLAGKGLVKLPERPWGPGELEAFLSRPKVRVPEGTVARLIEEERRED
jgi:prevent-host-death family protein